MGSNEEFYTENEKRFGSVIANASMENDKLNKSVNRYKIISTILPIKYFKKKLNEKNMLIERNAAIIKDNQKFLDSLNQTVYEKDTDGETVVVDFMQGNREPKEQGVE